MEEITTNYIISYTCIYVYCKILTTIVIENLKLKYASAQKIWSYFNEITLNFSELISILTCWFVDKQTFLWQCHFHLCPAFCLGMSIARWNLSNVEKLLDKLRQQRLTTAWPMFILSIFYLFWISRRQTIADLHSKSWTVKCVSRLHRQLWSSIFFCL